MPKKQMPSDWQPPVPAWQAEFADDVDHVVFAYFGCQRMEGKSAGSFAELFLEAIKGASAPSFVTRATHVDASHFRNDVFIAYWPSRSAFDTWWQSGFFADWWNSADRLGGPEGLWREIFAVKPNRMETLYSSPNVTGAGTLAKPLGEPVREHNYWGGMRDRIPDTVRIDDPFHGALVEGLPVMQVTQSRGQRIEVTLPDNLCLIRSGQDYSHCGPEELDVYQDTVRPTLLAGMNYLQDNPGDTNCLSCRLMDEVALDSSYAAQSFGLAVFASLHDLEAWAKSHPTHLRIFESFFRMVAQRNGQLDLRLWHEVLILDEQNSLCEYVNCHPNTGMLPWFRPRHQQIREGADLHGG